MMRRLIRSLPLAMLLLVLAGAAGAAEPLPRLYGVVLSAQNGAAYLEDPATGRVRAYRVGDTIGESRLVRIEPNRVILQRGGEQVEVRLAGAPAPPGAARALEDPPLASSSASEGGEVATTAAEPGPCPPSCPPASMVTPAPPAAGQPCPPACPPAQTLGSGQAGPAWLPGAGGATAPTTGDETGCPPNCVPAPQPPTDGPQPCPPACPPASVVYPAGAATGGGALPGDVPVTTP